MFANEGISDDLFKAFLIYLVSHPRPAHELLCPRRLDISAQYSDEFLGMTVEDLSLDALLEARERLVREIHGRARQPAKHQFQIRRASGRERVCQYVEISVGTVSIKKQRTI